MIYLISACLLGCPCRYDGAAKPIPDNIRARLEEDTLIPVCPECLGGLPTPRIPAERRGARVVNREGRDVTEEYARGAREVLRLARLYGADGVILRSKSPSCGTNGVYDGSFSGTLRDGMGVTAELLLGEGVDIFDEYECPPSSGNKKIAKRS